MAFRSPNVFLRCLCEEQGLLQGGGGGREDVARLPLPRRRSPPALLLPGERGLEGCPWSTGLCKRKRVHGEAHYSWPPAAAKHLQHLVKTWGCLGVGRGCQALCAAAVS